MCSNSVCSNSACSNSARQKTFLPETSLLRNALSKGAVALTVAALICLPFEAFAQQPKSASGKSDAAAHSTTAASKKAKSPQQAMAAKPDAHRLIIQVNQNDPAVMNLALNNATNVLDYYRAKGEAVDVDIVTYGPGLNMLRADTSPVQDRIKHLKDYAFPSKIQFSACNNTKENMEKKEGHPIAVLAEAVIIPSGVVRVMELQEKGWSYVRP